MAIRFFRAALAVGLIAMFAPVLESAFTPAGATTSNTMHYTSVQNAWGTPTQPPPITNVSTCSPAILNDWTLANFTGNGVNHFNMNNAGDAWSTSTFTGTGTVVFYPASSLDPRTNGPVVVGPYDMTVTGHVTQWFGFDANKQNQVFNGTIDFRGTVNGTGASISFHENAQFVWTPGMDPNGPPKFYVEETTC